MGSSHQLRDGHLGGIFCCTRGAASFLVAGTSKFIMSRCPQRFACTSLPRRAQEEQGGLQTADCRLQRLPAVFSYNAKCEMKEREDKKGSIFGMAGHFPSSFQSHRLRKFTPRTLMARVPLCQLVSSGADATMTRIEWMERLSGACRSAHLVTVEYSSDHPSMELPQ